MVYVHKLTKLTVAYKTEAYHHYCEPASTVSSNVQFMDYNHSQPLKNKSLYTHGMLLTNSNENWLGN